MSMSANGMRPYRLGLDLGTNSLGWFLVWLDRGGGRWRPIGLGPGGVRVFPDGRDPQSKTSNAVTDAPHAVPADAAIASPTAISAVAPS